MVTEKIDKIKEELNPFIWDMISEIRASKYSIKNCCWPFMPYIGEKYQDLSTNKKVLIVGKAPYESDKDKEACMDDNKCIDQQTFFRNLQEQNKAYYSLIKNCIIPFYGGEKSCYNSRFWQRIYRLIPALLDNKISLPKYKREPVQSQKCFESIAWTNMFKITFPMGNPSKELINIIKPLCIKTLNKEIEILQPSIILFSTGKPYDCYLKEFFNISDIDDGPIEKLKININKFRGVAFRTKHFQALRNCELEKLYNTLKEKEI